MGFKNTIEKIWFIYKYLVNRVRLNVFLLCVFMIMDFLDLR